MYIDVFIELYIYTASQKYLVAPKNFISHPKGVIFNETS